MDTESKEKSLIKELLLALVPYTRQNTLLVFKPNQFFNELERNSGYPKDKLRKTYYRAKQEKIITIDRDRPILSLKGRQIVQPFIANKLSNNAQLMVIFDIPEEYAGRRQRLRNLLKQLDFKQIQLSVWMSDKDHQAIIFESIVELELQQWAQVYEASRIVK
jgi:hypothetical protein